MITMKHQLTRKKIDAQDKDTDIPQEKKLTFAFKLFGTWDSTTAVVDKSLEHYINTDARLLPRSAGIHRGKFHKSKMHIVERLALHLLVTGHYGKRHRMTSGRFGGNLYQTLHAVEDALALVEEKEKKNPIEVLVTAVQNAAVREEIISYQLGSTMARESVITSPQRRVDKTLRYMAQGAYRKSFHSKRTLAGAIATEILAAYAKSSDSTAIKEKERIEREATGAR